MKVDETGGNGRLMNQIKMKEWRVILVGFENLWSLKERKVRKMIHDFFRVREERSNYQVILFYPIIDLFLEVLYPLNP